MTYIAAFRCATGIVMCADTLETRGDTKNYVEKLELPDDTPCPLVIGGSGKTSLACQLCQWAMDADPTCRLSKHAMLPIFLEQKILELENEKGSLAEMIRSELWYLVGTPEPPSLELVEWLLKKRRVLLVIDGLSELTDAKRNAIQPGKPQFAGRALLITSRLDESLPGVDLTVIKPMRVERDHLSTFMDAYLVQRKKKELFSDVEYFDYLGRLSRLVQERDITVLLAKLYADQLVAAKEGISRRKLAENIPDLMLEYLNELNGKVGTRRIDDKLMHRAAKISAWQCMRKTFRSMPASMDRVASELKSISDDPSGILRACNKTCLPMASKDGNTRGILEASFMAIRKMTLPHPVFHLPPTDIQP